MASVWFPLVFKLENGLVFLVNAKLVRSGSGPVVGGFDDEEVHAEENRNEDQRGDTKGCFERDILDNSTGDCLAEAGSDFSMSM